MLNRKEVSFRRPWVIYAIDEGNNIHLFNDGILRHALRADCLCEPTYVTGYEEDGSERVVLYHQPLFAPKEESNFDDDD